VDPPQEDWQYRRDAPLQLDGILASSSLASSSSSSAPRLLVELSADASPHSSADMVAAIVRTAPQRGVPELLAECLAAPPLSPEESARLFSSLQDRPSSPADLSSGAGTGGAGAASADSGGAGLEVECASPWVQPLLCPVTQERLKVPARGRGCRHLRCFELEAYLVASTRAVFHRRWHCPVCDHPLPPSDVAVCCLTQQLLREAPGGVTEAAIEEKLAGLRWQDPAATSPLALATPPRPSPPRASPTAVASVAAAAAAPVAVDGGGKFAGECRPPARRRRWSRSVLQPPPGAAVEIHTLPMSNPGCDITAVAVAHSSAAEAAAEEPAAKSRRREVATAAASWGRRLAFTGDAVRGDDAGVRRELSLQVSLD